MFYISFCSEAEAEPITGVAAGEQSGENNYILPPVCRKVNATSPNLPNQSQPQHFLLGQLRDGLASSGAASVSAEFSPLEAPQQHRNVD